MVDTDAQRRLLEEIEREQSRHWNCPLCGEGYPSRENAIGLADAVVLFDEEIDDVLAALKAAGNDEAVAALEGRRTAG